MADISQSNWSEVDADNNQNPPDGWPANMLPNAVEPTARGMMGGIKRFWDRINGTITTTGSAGVYTYTPTNAASPAGYVQGEAFTFRAHQTAVGGDSFQVAALGALPLYVSSGAGMVAISAGAIQNGAMIEAVYDSNLGGSGAFQITAGATPSITALSGTLGVAHGGTGVTSGTNGGVLSYQGGSNYAWSATLAANAIVMGGGSGSTPLTEPDWVFSGHALTANVNSASAPAILTGRNLHINGEDSTMAGILLDTYAGAPVFTGRRTAGTGAAPSATTLNNILVSLEGRGYGATGYSSAIGSVALVAHEQLTDSAQGTRWNILTTPIGSTTPAVIATFDNQGCALTGTTTNDSASAGFVGEVISSAVMSGSPVSIGSSNAVVNVTSISLTAGDWDVHGEVWVSTTTGTRVRAAISTVSASLPGDAAIGTSETILPVDLSASTQVSVALSPCRASLSGTTTYYLVASATYSGSAPGAFGKIWARRAR